MTRLLTVEEVAERLGVNEGLGLGTGARRPHSSCPARAVSPVQGGGARAVARGPRAPRRRGPAVGTTLKGWWAHDAEPSTFCMATGSAEIVPRAARSAARVRAKHDHGPRPPLDPLGADGWRTRLAGGGATHLSSHARHPRPATSDKTRAGQTADLADSLKESQLAAGRDHPQRVGHHRRPQSQQQASKQERTIRQMTSVGARHRTSWRIPKAPEVQGAMRQGLRLGRPRGVVHRASVRRNLGGGAGTSQRD